LSIPKDKYISFSFEFSEYRLSCLNYHIVKKHLIRNIFKAILTATIFFCLAKIVFYI
jgi:hypothetical protein